MRHLSLIFALAFLGGLLFSSQALAIEQYRQGDTQKVAALTGDELKQWHLAQMHPQDDQMQVQSLTRAQIREMQALLKHRGYYISSYESDEIGRETMAAIQNFQQDQGLAITGLPNDETLRALVLTTPQHEFFGIAPEFGDDIE